MNQFSNVIQADKIEECYQELAHFFTQAYNITTINIYSKQLISAKIFSCLPGRIEELQCDSRKYAPGSNLPIIYDTNQGNAVTDALLALNIKNLNLAVEFVCFD